jgi:murein DD-endopeptidase MepM/ murein hydrolase activator NlpD
VNGVWRRLRLLVVIVVTSGATFALVTWVGQWAVSRSEPERYALGPSPTPSDPLISAYAAVDPALIPALEAALTNTQPDALTVIIEGIPPIGMYLPATGNTQFELPPPTVTPTLSPLKTTTPLPSLTPAPTYDATTSGTLSTLPAGAGGADCAPAGWPAPGLLTQYFYRYHRAIDIGVPLNTPVVATHSGQVIFAGWRTDGYGNLIIVQSGRFISYYAHLTDFNVTEGQIVARNSVIGWSGSTGNSTGPHIHYEIRIDDVEVDPLTFEERGYMTC